jgi:hypothetical protein
MLIFFNELVQQFFLYIVETFEIIWNEFNEYGVLKHIFKTM